MVSTLLTVPILRYARHAASNFIFLAFLTMVQGNDAIAIIFLVLFSLIFLVGLCICKLRYRTVPPLRSISPSPPIQPGPFPPPGPQQPMIPIVRPDPRQNGRIPNVRPPAGGRADINVRDD